MIHDFCLQISQNPDSNKCLDENGNSSHAACFDIFSDNLIKFQVFQAKLATVIATEQTM